MLRRIRLSALLDRLANETVACLIHNAGVLYRDGIEAFFCFGNTASV